MKQYIIWQKITYTGTIEIEDEAQIISVADEKDDKGKPIQVVTYIMPTSNNTDRR